MESKPKGIITNATWNSAYVVWTMGISFVVTPVLIHHLGTSLYGILLIVWSVTGILGVMNLGLGEATMRYVARYHGDRDMQGVNRVFGATLSLFVVICGVVSAALLIGAPVIVTWLNVPPEQHHMVAWLLRLSALSISCSIIMSVFGAIPAALQRFDVLIKVNLAGSVLRACGYIALALSGQGLISIVIWDLLLSSLAFWLIIRAAHKLLPGLRLLPPFSFGGLREIFGYSIFSFLTFFVHKWHRESGKLLMARFLGTAPVAYLGTPDNLAQRIHDVIASGVEALLPRFSANRDPKAAESMFWSATWAAVALSVIFFVPFFVLVPDFLSLWISRDFALHSGVIGQLLALYLIFQGAFAPAAAYYRGVGKPWFVTIVLFFSLLITVLSGVYLIPRQGPTGAAYAYLAGSAAPLLGVIVGGIHTFGPSACLPLLRTLCLPVLAGGLAGGLGLFMRSYSGELTWISLAAYGALSVTTTFALVVGADWILGGENAPSKQVLERLASHDKVGFLFRWVG